MRSAKDNEFPYRMSTVCYFEVDKKGQVSRVHHKNKSDINEVLEAYKRAAKGTTTLYGVLPGKHSSDLFIIDDLELFANSFELFSLSK